MPLPSSLPAPLAALALSGCVIVVDDEGGSGYPPPPSSSTTDASTGSSSSSADGASSAAPSSTTSAAPGPDACGAFAVTAAPCLGEDYATYAEGQCLEAYAEAYAYGPACADAFVDYFACLAALPCRELLLGSSCPTELDAYQLACPT